MDYSGAMAMRSVVVISLARFIQINLATGDLIEAQTIYNTTQF